MTFSIMALQIKIYRGQHLKGKLIKILNNNNWMEQQCCQTFYIKKQKVHLTVENNDKLYETVSPNVEILMYEIWVKRQFIEAAIHRMAFTSNSQTHLIFKTVSRM